MDQIHSAMVMLKVYLLKKSEITKLNYSKLNLTKEHYLLDIFMNTHWKSWWTIFNLVTIDQRFKKLEFYKKLVICWHANMLEGNTHNTKITNSRKKEFFEEKWWECIGEANWLWGCLTSFRISAP